MSKPPRFLDANGPGHAGVRGPDHRQLGDGAARDPEAVAAWGLACQRRRAAQLSSALRPAGRRGYTVEQHREAEALVLRAQELLRMAADKPAGQRRYVEQCADDLIQEAERLVPTGHRRRTWK